MPLRTIYIASIILCLVISPLAKRNRTTQMESVQSVYNLNPMFYTLMFGTKCSDEIPISGHVGMFQVHIDYHANTYIGINFFLSTLLSSK
ncbi:hypothetical protein D0Y65_030245 [Glycine soja]|uniref:Uncharacterized protein n=1 Tax=Glycine soja TaxID=3848 RepID=A0A445I323_GLYSO|nr:hypothetical protein JHK87_031232 [Glycine soja]RZB80445.1 hypothetical protein D0Y65_030245 [Glycine soja]